ncbi:MAG: response regulator [Planctomycetota bacterium]
MRLDAMTVGVLRRAVAIYAEVAWNGATGMKAFELPEDDKAPVGAVLTRLTDESLRSGDQATRRYTLRLGNPRYPFMKLVLQEHLVEDEFFLSVDTHDQMFSADAHTPEEELKRLKHYNLGVREAVEAAWSREGLPTAKAIKGLVEGWPTRRAPPNGWRLLLVDNDENIAGTLALLLEARGYSVSILNDGREAVEQADPAKHDLILMDNEMEHLNGFEACRVLKSRPATARIPVLIATAGALTLQQLDAADGFMVKPYRMELLFSLLDHMLGRQNRL